YVEQLFGDVNPKHLAGHGGARGLPGAAPNVQHTFRVPLAQRVVHDNGRGSATMSSARVRSRADRTPGLSQHGTRAGSHWPPEARRRTPTRSRPRTPSAA